MAESEIESDVEAGKNIQLIVMRTIQHGRIPLTKVYALTFSGFISYLFINDER